MKKILLIILIAIATASCTSGGHIVVSRKECIYINISSRIKETKKANFNTVDITLTNGKVVYGVPPEANLKNLPVCHFRNRYFYIKQ
mgnify:CR=1 FL=1